MTNSRYEDIYESLPEELKSKVRAIPKWKSPRYKRNYRMFFSDFFDDVKDFKDFIGYMFEKYEEEEEDNCEVELYHNRNYWYDSKEDKYIIYIRSK